MSLVKASEFMARYQVGHCVDPIDPPTDRVVTPGLPWFRVRFMFTERHDYRWIEVHYCGTAEETFHGLSDHIGDVFYGMADIARTAGFFDDWVAQGHGGVLPASYEQWEQPRKDLRRRCRIWLPDDTMWNEFLALEPDTPPGNPA